MSKETGCASGFVIYRTSLFVEVYTQSDN